MDNGTIIALGAAAAIAFVVWRSRRRTEASAPSGAAAVCSAVGLPSAVCAPVLDRVVAAVTPTPNRSNRDLNGAAVLTADELNRAATVEVREMVAGGPSTNYRRPISVGGWIGDAGGAVVRYANGCTPFEGSEGWAKCAPGTADMRSPYPGVDDRVPGADYLSGAAWTGASGDPLTRLRRVLPDGREQWWDRGELTTCPPGETVGQVVRGPLSARRGCHPRVVAPPVVTPPRPPLAPLTTPPRAPTMPSFPRSFV